MPVLSGVAPFANKLPGDHAFADMDAPVVGNAGLYDLIPIGFIDLRYAPAEEIIPEMTQVQGFVGIGRRIFHHDAAGH